MADSNFTCLHCGGVIVPRINKTTGLPSKAKRKFCSRVCGDKFREPLRGPRKRAPHKPKPVDCEHCKKTVMRRVAGGGKDAGRFCSRECAFAAASDRKLIREAEMAVRSLVSRHVKREAMALRRIAAYVERSPIFSFACIRCGTMMMVRRRLGLHKQVCDACIRERNRTNNRIRKLRMRAIKTGADADRIDPIRVFERDGWRCHICGQKTLRRYRGTQHDRAPELEHIVSFADGGTHTWGNVACACKKCNQSKGASSFGQLGLRIPA